MTDDLDRRLQHLDEIEAPNLSARIGAGPERPLPPLPSPGRRVMVGVLAFVVAAAGFAFLAGGRSPVPVSQQTPRSVEKVSVSHMLTGALSSVRCTASVPAVLTPGQPIDLTLTLRNVGDQQVSIDNNNEGDRLTISDTGGEVFDSLRAYELSRSLGGPYIRPTELRPGGVLHRGGGWTAAMWSGPLTLVPTCGGTRLPAMRVGVAVPGLTPSPNQAIDAAAGAMEGLFSDCRPSPGGDAVMGTIHPPTGNASVPAMHAACSAVIRQESGFASVQLWFVTPPTLGRVSVTGPYDQIKIPLGTHRPYEVSVWDFEVDKTGVRLVGGREIDSTLPANRMAPDWDWTGTAWEGPGGSRCGDSGYGGAVLAFISVCPSN